MKNKMKKYKRKSEIVEATQWMRDGDGPVDHVARMPAPDHSGNVVVPYCKKGFDDFRPCSQCGLPLMRHGFLHPLVSAEFRGSIVCPRDYIVMDGGNMFTRYQKDRFFRVFEVIEEIEE